MERFIFKLKNINEDDLKLFAEKIGKCLKGNEIFLLMGNLGAGKTIFTKYLVSSIDKSLENEVNSPTFVVMNVYETGKFNIYHIDLYRVKNFDLTDIIGNGVILIEWPNENEFEDINLPIIKIRFNIEKDINKRDIEVEIINGNYLKDCLDKLGDRD